MKTKGISLIEILVALLILMVGLLGMAGLQIRGLSNNHNAYLSSQAYQLASDILNRMQSNNQGINANYYIRAYADMPSTDCIANACSSEQMAEYDLSVWNKTLNVQLPAGRSQICIDSSPQTLECDGSGNRLSITLFWSERENGTRVEKHFTTSFQP